jgi:hypothetical protein
MAGEPEFERTDTRPPPSDAGHRIVASALTAWVAGEKSYFYLRAFSRKWNNIHALQVAEGKAVLHPKNLKDLLAHYLERKAKGLELAFKQWLDHQLEPFVSGRG